MRRVLITGVANGIGAATARLFKASGWWVCGVDLVKAEQADVDVDKYWEGDVTDKRLWEDIVASVELQEGLHALVNNAAVQVNSSLAETSEEEWQRVIDVNLKSSFLSMKHLMPLLRRVSGSVVNGRAVNAVATVRGLAEYAASKGGLVALTKAVALEEAAHNVRVNAVLPGAVSTNMLREGFARGHSGDGSIEEQIHELADKTPCGRVARPDEIAKVIGFLADSEQSSYIVGQAVVADGGATVRLSTE
mgnify:CR=1 FL=1